MRALVLGIIMVAAATAHAQRVALATGDDQQRTALAVALGGRVGIMPVAPPNGELRLERAADAQRAAVAVGANATVWIDEVDVCVVSADGATFRHAPLPGSDSPRVFAAIAASLLDELLAPPETPVSVDVHVELGAPAGFAPFVPAAPPIAIAAPGTIAVPPPPVDDRPPRFDRTLFEVGPMLSPATLGATVEIMFPMSPHWRFGFMGTANGCFLPDCSSGMIYGGGLEIRHVGHGRRHFDVGVTVGALGATSAPGTIVFAGIPLALTWEHATSGISLSLVPGIAASTDSSSDGAIPAVWATLRWIFPV